MRFEFVILCLALAGCRFDTLQDQGYRGEPLLTVSGSIQSGGDVELDPEVAARSRVAVFWVGDTETPAPQRQNISTFERSLTYELELFEPPPQDLRWELPGLPGQIAWAYVVLYDDVNEDGQWDPEREPATGVTEDHVIFFTTQGIPAGLVSPSSIAPGYGIYGLLECAPNEDGELERALSWRDPFEELGRVTLSLQPSDDFLAPDFACEGAADPCVDALLELERERPVDARDSIDEFDMCFLERGIDLVTLCRGPWRALQEHEQTNTPADRTGPIDDLVECAELHIELRDL